MTRAPLRIVLDYRQEAKVSLNVLAGALETAPDTAAIPLDFVSRQRPLADAVAQALATSERVLVLGSFYSPAAAAQAERLRAVREQVPDPRAVFVAGGPHASAEPLATLADGWDRVALGEGEATVVALARAALAGPDLDAVPNLARLDPQGGLVRSARAPAVTLDDWPPFAPGHGRLGPIELTRGCIYACGFCQTPFLNRARFRHRSLDNVARWVRHQRAAGFRDYRFITPTSFSYGASGPEPDLEALEALLRTIRGEIGPQGRLYYGTFPSEVRPEHVTREGLRLLRRWVDNRSLIVGAQSGSDAVLGRLHRGHDVAAVERAVAIALEEGFVPHLDFIFGLPEETAADVEASLQLAEALAARGAKVHGHTFMPLPGTPLSQAPAGALTPETRTRLDRLASRGALYGQWRRQAALAGQLVQLRRRGAPQPRNMPGR